MPSTPLYNTGFPSSIVNKVIVIDDKIIKLKNKKNPFVMNKF